MTSEAFDVEKRRAFFEEKAVEIAWHAAANAASVLGGAKTNSLAWPACADDGKVPKSARAALAAFVRMNGEIPPEALFRFAGACGYHKIAVDDFSYLPLQWRAPFDIFTFMLAITDEFFEATLKDEQRADAQARAAPVAAAFALNPDDRIDALQPNPLALRDGVTLQVVEAPDAESPNDEADAVGDGVTLQVVEAPDAESPNDAADAVGEMLDAAGAGDPAAAAVVSGEFAANPVQPAP